MTWTKPYYGVQHLKGHNLLDGSYRVIQVTVCEYITFASLQRWLRDSNTNCLKAIGEDVIFDTAGLARAAGEAWFKTKCGDNL